MNKVLTVTTRILLQSPFLTEMTLLEVSDDVDFETVRQAALDAIPLESRHPDNEVSVEGDDDAKSALESKVTDGMRLHVSRCKKITVVVRYMGQPKSHDFAPATRVKRVKDWAVHEFKIPDAEAARHGLYLPGTEQELSGDTHIGSLAHSAACLLTLDLLPTDRIQGT